MKVIEKELIFLDTSFSNQEELFEFLAHQIVITKRGREVKEIVRGFYDREAEFSTAMGNGIAIPHCRNSFIDSATVIVVRNNQDISWTDGEKVNLFFALLVPGSNENQMHIRILAQVAQLIMEDEFIDTVKRAQNSLEIYEYLSVLNNKEQEEH